MKNILFFFIILMGAIIISNTAASHFNKFISGEAFYALMDETKPYLIKEFNMGTSGKLKVKTSGGSINVVGQNGNTIKVEMYVRKANGGFFGKSSDSDIAKALESYDINISKDGNTVSAIAESKGWSWSSKNNMSISFTVYVPFEISSDLNTSGGSINLTDLRGDQKVHTSGGSINCKEVDGDLKAHTSGGSINVENYQGVLDATTSGGSIKLKNANGKLKVHTSGGGISLNEVSGSIDAGTSGGSINADIKKLEASLSLKTSGGSINATVPAGQGVDLDLKGSRVNTQLMNFNGKTERDKIVGSMNGGGIPVKLSTSGGHVNLNFRN
ncbi:hypothetical protein BH23BAC1_BH23BAC1_23000 [soil metagenome]